MLLQLVVRRTAVGAVHSRRHAVPVCSCRKALQFAAWRISHGEATSLFTWIVSASEAVEICSLTTPYCGLPVRIEKVHQIDAVFTLRRLWTKSVCETRLLTRSVINVTRMW